MGSSDSLGIRLGLRDVRTGCGQPSLWSSPGHTATSRKGKIIVENEGSLQSAADSHVEVNQYYDVRNEAKEER